MDSDPARRPSGPPGPPGPSGPPGETLFVRPGVAGGHDGLPDAHPDAHPDARPDGHPDGGDGEPAPMPAGSAESHATRSRSVPRREALTTEQIVAGVVAGDRTRLARAITLVESNAPSHSEQAQAVLSALLPRTGGAVRIGISGVPGAGKSTFIEAFGTLLTAAGHQVAVTAVDPSSSLSGGSILGDKTRMERLAADPRAFIRPAPSGGALGGVARKTRETILLFEAAGYDVVLVETVGVGQSEILVRSMVDFFLLLTLSGGGDELQAIKKGIMEIADAVVVHKADGPNRLPAEAARAEIARVLHYLRPATKGWQTRAFAASAVTGDGIAELWSAVQAFTRHTQANGGWERRRRGQEREWLHALLRDRLWESFLAHPAVAALLPELEQAVIEGRVPATTAARRILQTFE